MRSIGFGHIPVLCPLLVLLLCRGAILSGDPTYPLDERVILHVGDVTGDPGETGLLIPVYLEVKPDGPEVHTWNAVFRYNPDVLEFSWLKLPPRGMSIADVFPPSLQGEEGVVSLRISCWYLEDRIQPGESGHPLELVFCVREGAPPGTYPLETTPGATVLDDDGSFVETSFWNDLTSGRPAQEGGSVTVTETPVNIPVPCPPPPDGGFLPFLPEHEKVILEVGPVAAAPGESNLTFPLSIRIEPEGPSIDEIQGFLRFDPDAMDIVGVEDSMAGISFELLPPAYFDEPGKIGFRAHSGESLLSPDHQGVLARLRFCVPGEASPGTHPVEFLLHTSIIFEGQEYLTWFHRAGAPQGSHLQFHPILEDGLLVVEGEPVSGDVCSSLIPTDPVTFALGDVTGAPGETGLALPLSIIVEPTFSVSRWSVIIRYDPSVIADAYLQYAGSLGVYHQTCRDYLQFREPGTVSLDVQYAHPSRLTSADDATVATLHFCLREDAPPGKHPIRIIPSAELLAEGGSIETTCFLWWPVQGWQREEPALQEGSVMVAGEPRQGSCYPDLPPGPIHSTFRLGDGATVPGGSVAIPFTIRSDMKTRGFQFSIDFDEEILEATEIEKGAIPPEEEYDFEVLKLNNENQTPGGAGVDEGFLAGTVLYRDDYPYFYLPPNQDNEVLIFHFRAKSDAAPGTASEVLFLDGARLHPDAPGLMNLTVITHGRETRSLYPGVDVSYVYLASRIGINGDVSIFVRGDSNGDENLDISDVLFTLDFLFLGGPRPACQDAADANDDGMLDIADPIHFLSYFFLGRFDSLPAPHPLPGVDPTPDQLFCGNTRS